MMNYKKIYNETIKTLLGHTDVVRYFKMDNYMYISYNSNTIHAIPLSKFYLDVHDETSFLETTMIQEIIENVHNTSITLSFSGNVKVWEKITMLCLDGEGIENVLIDEKLLKLFGKLQDVKLTVQKGVRYSPVAVWSKHTNELLGAISQMNY